MRGINLKPRNAMIRQDVLLMSHIAHKSAHRVCGDGAKRTPASRHDRNGKFQGHGHDERNDARRHGAPSPQDWRAEGGAA